MTKTRCAFCDQFVHDVDARKLCFGCQLAMDFTLRIEQELCPVEPADALELALKLSYRVMGTLTQRHEAHPVTAAERLMHDIMACRTPYGFRPFLSQTRH